MPEEKKDKPEESPIQPTAKVKAPVGEILERVKEKIDDAESILVTLSNNPSVDEMASAIGLTIALDQIGKHVTAIYSGKTPNAIQFLEPEKTFESNTNSLQDFIIALNKEKADHLRYKIEGNFVKVFITPYKTTISEKDLEFSRGDINVDLIICLNVMSIEELDAALQEHGRILHDAGLINISNAVPGRIGGTEWNNTKASSIAEMLIQLFDLMKLDIGSDVATALLTGIIAATDRFSNEKTSPDTMAVSAKLMEKGADQQLITASMSPKPKEKAVVEDDVLPDSIDADTAEDAAEETGTEEAEAKEPEDEKKTEKDTTVMDVQNADDDGVEVNIAAQSTPNVPEAPNESEIPDIPAIPNIPEVSDAPETAEATLPPIDSQPSGESDDSTNENSSTPETSQEEENTELSPEQQLEQIIAQNNNAAPEIPATELFNPQSQTKVEPTPEEANEVAAVPTAAVPVNDVYGAQSERTDFHDGVVDPMENIEQPKDYGAMMEQALAEATPTVNAIESPSAPIVSTPEQPGTPSAPAVPVDAESSAEQSVNDMVNQMVNQAQQANVPVPQVEQQVPQLPVPPVPPVDMNMMPPATPSLPPVQITPEQVMVQPVPQPAPVSMQQPVPQPAPQPDSLSASQPMTQPVPESVPQPMPAETSPAPAVEQDPSEASGIPTAPENVPTQAEPVNPVVVQPVQDPASVPPVQDPGAFKIPGM